METGNSKWVEFAQGFTKPSHV